MSHYIRTGFFVLMALLIVAFVLLPATACGCGRGNPYYRQTFQMRDVLEAAKHYTSDYGTPPRTDDISPWYAKLIDSPDEQSSRCCPGGYLYDVPTDHFGNILVMEYSESDGEFTIRSVGENGVDDHGKLDDWTLGREPNLGYWYKKNWVQSSALASMSLIFSAAITLLWTRIVRRFAGRFVLSALTIGVLNGLVTNDFGSYPAPLVSITGSIGMIALVVGAFIAICWFIGASTKPKSAAARISMPPVCSHCGYDMRGSPSGVCSECGRAQSDDPFGDFVIHSDG